jgi:hypothetical protein
MIARDYLFCDAQTDERGGSHVSRPVHLFSTTQRLRRSTQLGPRRTAMRSGALVTERNFRRKNVFQEYRAVAALAANAFPWDGCLTLIAGPRHESTLLRMIALTNQLAGDMSTEVALDV